MNNFPIFHWSSRNKDFEKSSLEEMEEESNDFHDEINHFYDDHNDHDNDQNDDDSD